MGAEHPRHRSGRATARVAARADRVVELDDEEKPELLRHYLQHWKWKVGQFFEGVGPDAPKSEIRRIAPNHPVFRIT